MVQPMDINDVLEVIADFGRIQWLYLLLNGVVCTIFAFQMFIIVFSHGVPAFRCADDGFYSNQMLINTTDTAYYDSLCEQTSAVDGINITAKCQSYEYDQSVFGSSIVTEFDLVCDRTTLVTWINVSWMLSDAVGTLIGSYLSDRFGRKKILLAVYLVFGVSGLLCAFAQHIVMYIVFRCIMAMVCFGGFTAAISICSEIIAPTKRAHMLNSLNMFWLVGSLALPLLAYLIIDWRYLQLATTVIAIPCCIAVFWLVDESPHWLLTNGKHIEAYEVLRKMARINKKEFPLVQPDDLIVAKGDDGKDAARESCCSIWKYRIVLVRFTVFTFGWIVCSFCYYALSFGVSVLPGSIHLNLFLMSAVEGLGYLFCFTIAWLGRKWTTVGCFFGGGLSLLAFALLTSLGSKTSQSVSIGLIVTSLIGKFCASASWQILFVWSSECYPTSNRCLLISINGLGARLGGTLAPIMLDLHKLVEVPHEDMIVPLLYVVMMLVAGALCLIPPETNNAKMIDTMKEANTKYFEISKKPSKAGSASDQEVATAEEEKFLDG